MLKFVLCFKNKIIITNFAVIINNEIIRIE